MGRKRASQATTSTTQKATTDQTTSVKQSVEIMQTLIHGSVSSVLFARRMVPDECFGIQDYKPSDPHLTYEKFSKHANQSLAKNPHARGVHVLKRGIRPRVDKLLDWLEGGVFDALKRGYLRSLQLAVSTDPRQLANVVELYTFTFDYTRDAIQNVTMTGPQGQKITVKNARIALRTMIQDLVMYCQNMPTLPPRGALRAYMTYTEECPQKYEPPGFEPSSDNTVMLPGSRSNPDWTVDTMELRSADVGHHSVSLQILSLSQVMGEDTEEAQIPTQMTYDSPADRWTLAGVHARKPIEMLNVMATQEAEIDERETGNNTSSDQRKTGTTTRIDREVIENTPVDDASTIHESTPSTRPEEDLGIRERLRRMLPPSAEPTDTQPTQQQDLSAQTSSQQPKAAIQASALQLSQTVIQQLEKVRSVVLPPPRESTVVRGRSEDPISTEDDKVNCQCNFNEEEGDMMQCCFCDTWQHLHCYGYLGADDQRMPAVYACYECLLQGREDNVLRELRTITLYRRTIHLLEKHDLANDKELSALLHCGIQDTYKLRERLQKQGFLSPFPKGGKGSRRLVLVRMKAVISQMREEYFNPLRSIAHLFELPRPSALQLEISQNASQGDSQVGISASIPEERGETENNGQQTRSTTGPEASRKRFREDAAESRTPKPKRSRTQGILPLELTPSPSSTSIS